MMKHRRFAGEDVVRFKVKDWLPHRDEMLLVDGTAYKDEKTVRLSLSAPLAGIFTTPGKVLTPLAMIEMLAQLCGAQHSFDQKLAAGNLCGYLVGISSVKFGEPVYAGDKLDLAAWKVFEMKDIKRVKGEVSRGDMVVGEAELTLYKADEWISKPGIAANRKEPEGVVNEEYRLWTREKDAVARGIVKSIRNIEIKPGESVEAALCFEPDFVGFSGHFPGWPVLPGVVIIYAGCLLVEIWGNKRLDLRSIKKAKFAAPIYPLDRMDVTLKHINNDDEQVDWYSGIIKCRGEVAAKYTIGTSGAREVC